VQFLNGIGMMRYNAPFPLRLAMSWTVTASRRKSVTGPVRVFSGLTLEAEILSLYSLAPDTVEQLPALFSESVVKSCTSVLGEASGEALVRRIGDSRLQSPYQVYTRIDSFLSKGADILKEAIRNGFRERVHRLYRVVMNLEARRLAPALANSSTSKTKGQLPIPRPSSTNSHSRV
jgi:hypothetical protein